jgi:hypothetical protein
LAAYWGIALLHDRGLLVIIVSKVVLSAAADRKGREAFVHF